MPRTAYIETTVVSYLVARPSRDIRVAARQEITHEWWNGHGRDFVMHISQLVLDEAASGDADASERRLEELQDRSVLAITDEAIELAEKLVAGGVVPREAAGDALYIAIAAVHGMDYLLTWNCRHIANAAMRNRIGDVCLEVGCEPPVICTPEELLED